MTKILFFGTTKEIFGDEKNFKNLLCDDAKVCFKVQRGLDFFSFRSFSFVFQNKRRIFLCDSAGSQNRGKSRKIGGGVRGQTQGEESGGEELTKAVKRQKKIHKA